MRIVFMGTPDFAVYSLDALLKAGHEIVGVFTQPDKPQGRKMILTPSPIKEFALKNGLTVYQPTSVKTDEAFDLIKELNPELIAVVAYGKILPEQLLSVSKLGCVNVHASLLPKYRGASPIQWAIYCGDSVTGVTTQLMDKGVDTGDILMTESIDIASDDNFETLHDKLAVIGAQLLVKTVDGLNNCTIIPTKQSDDNVSYAPIIKKEMGLIDFSKTAKEVDCMIRAFTPWPSAFFFMDGLRIKVLSATLGPDTLCEFGTVIDIRNGLTVSCGSGTSIIIDRLQPEGKSAMTANALLNGHPVKVGTKL